MPDVPAPTQTPAPAPSLADEISLVVKWLRQHPLDALLGGAVIAAMAYFFGGVHLFVNHSETAARWAWLAWNPEQDQEHSKLVLPIIAYLIWIHRDEVRKAPKRGDALGLAFVCAGILLYLLSSRCVEARMALLSLPFLLYGSILFLWGKNVARILLFPCAFLIFLIPFGAIEQATFKLQFIVTSVVSTLSNLINIPLQDGTGTTLIARDNSFRFEVAGGCSGIHSIIALTMLSSVYAHLVHKEIWKKIIIVACSAAFAIIGNIGRIFTIILVAKWFNADLAGGKYHEYSPWLIFPFAIGAMLGVSKLLDLDYGKLFAHAKDSATPGEPGKPRSEGGSYDY